MPVTRSKRGTKEQQQLAAVSAALASGTAASKRTSFADDDDDQPSNPAAESSAGSIAQSIAASNGEDEDEDDDDEAPVEEVSNKSTKRTVATDAKKKKAEKKAADEIRKKADQERLLKRQQEAEAATLAEAQRKEERKQKEKAKGKGKGKASEAAAAQEDGEQLSHSSEVADDEQDVEKAGDTLDSDHFDVEEDDLDADLDPSDGPTDLDENDAVTAAPSAPGSLAASSQSTAGPSRLDPSLFAQVFAKKAPATKSILKRRAADPVTAEMEAEERLRRKKLRAKRQGGIVKGRDGLPMRRLDDGTIVRSLSSHSVGAAAGNKKTNFDDDEAAAEAEREDKTPLDPVLRPTLLDPSVALPNAKIRGFKKRKLGLTSTAKSAGQAGPAQPAKKKKGSAAPLRTEDDPLGLNDPAFLPGGEFYKPQKLTGARPRKDPKDTGAGKPGALARQGFRGRGGRTNALSAMSSGQRGGPALGFARSLAS